MTHHSVAVGTDVEMLNGHPIDASVLVYSHKRSDALMIDVAKFPLYINKFSEPSILTDFFSKSYARCISID